MLTAAVIMCFVPGSLSTRRALYHGNLKRPYEVVTNIIPILPRGKLKPRGADLLETTQLDVATSHHLALEVLFSPRRGHGASSARKEGEQDTESPSGPGPPGRGAPLPRHQG